MATRSPRELGRRVVVVSPHLDDAIFSLGASIARTAREGGAVCVLTVFAGDPDSDAQPGAYDRACGFSTAAEAARERREEDRRACALVGARPLWLPFADDQQSARAAPSVLRSAIAERIAAADTVLLPGYPLAHGDHRRVSDALQGAPLDRERIGLYIEQPYAAWEALSKRSRSPAGGWRALHPAPPPSLASSPGGPVRWMRPAASPRDWACKRQAARCYRSQLPRLRRWPLLRMHLYEAMRGGEGIAWVRG